VEDYNFLYVAFNYTPTLGLISHCCCRSVSWLSDCIHSTSRWGLANAARAFESLGSVVELVIKLIIW